MPATLPPIDPAIEIVIASTGMTQGTAQTEGVQIKPRAFIKIGDVQVGTLWRNIDSDLAGGVAVIFVRASRSVGQFHLDGGLAYRMRTGVKVRHDSHAWEFNAGARRDVGKLGLGVNAEFSPREFEKGYSLYVEGGPTLALNRATKLSVALGRRERRGAPDYWSANVGLTKTVINCLALDLRYYATDRPEVGERFHSRLVASARWSL